MTTRKDVIDHCLTYNNAYEDYPFDDPNWTVMRRRDTNKGFAWIFERQGNIWVNIKVDPFMAYDLREAFPSIVPAYHMNKVHWCSIILDGTVPEDIIESLIGESYRLCGKKK